MRPIRWANASVQCFVRHFLLSPKLFFGCKAACSLVCDGELQKACPKCVIRWFGWPLMERANLSSDRDHTLKKTAVQLHPEKVDIRGCFGYNAMAKAELNEKKLNWGHDKMMSWWNHVRKNTNQRKTHGLRQPGRPGKEGSSSPCFHFSTAFEKRWAPLTRPWFLYPFPTTL